MKTYKVDSISKYLSILENLNISDYIFRGQNEPYFSIQASGFRPYLGGWDSDKIYDMEHLHLAFFNRVIGQLSNDEKKYFLAFCQHHGIPTNLVDVSYSPLVALFFACDGKTDFKFSIQELISSKSLDELEKDKSLQNMFIHNLINQARKPFYSPHAQTYLLKKERLINITELITKLNGKNLFEEVLENQEVAFEFLDTIDRHFSSLDSSVVISWLKNIITTYLSVCEDEYNLNLSKNLCKSLKALLKSTPDVDEEFSTKVFTIIEDSLESSFYNNQYSKVTDKSNVSYLYGFILYEILNELKTLPRKINIDLDIYFTYQPPELFGRISSQQSFFIYQPYLHINDGVYDYCELYLQSINPDVTIQIDNYESILQELNILGINNGTIYGDIDNIAKAIVKSSGKLLKS